MRKAVADFREFIVVVANVPALDEEALSMFTLALL